MNSFRKLEIAFALPLTLALGLTGCLAAPTEHDSANGAEVTDGAEGPAAEPVSEAAEAWSSHGGWGSGGWGHGGWGEGGWGHGGWGEGGWGEGGWGHGGWGHGDGDCGGSGYGGYPNYGGCGYGFSQPCGFHHRLGCGGRHW